MRVPQVRVRAKMTSSCPAVLHKIDESRVGVRIPGLHFTPYIRFNKTKKN